jgi:hypothetical protein
VGKLFKVHCGIITTKPFVLLLYTNSKIKKNHQKIQEIVKYKNGSKGNEAGRQRVCELRRSLARHIRGRPREEPSSWVVRLRGPGNGNTASTCRGAWVSHDASVMSPSHWRHHLVTQENLPCVCFYYRPASRLLKHPFKLRLKAVIWKPSE